MAHPPPPPLPHCHLREEDGRSWPFLVWRFAEPRRVISSAPVGGGIGERVWIINAQVRSGYDRTDLEAHIAELAGTAGLTTDVQQGSGVGMLTAADVTGAVATDDEGVDVLATVGIRVPTWASSPAGRPDAVIPPTGLPVAVPGPPDPVPATVPPGTINVVALVPVAMSDAALVNLVATATEAKTQALLDAAVPGTGTATDAVCIVCPAPTPGRPLESFGGPRSAWGSRVARATYESVRSGIDGSLRIITAADPPPAPPAGGNRP